MGKLRKGYIQIYTGNGKGKTTAALGQALRGAGFGLKTFIIQFMKEYPYNELNSIARLKDFIKIEQVGNDDFVLKRELPATNDISKAKLGLKVAYKLMMSGEYDIIILDEVFAALYFKLLSVDDLLPFFNDKPETVELIFTGRYCPAELYEKADLVTEMKEIKHYYQKGVLSRRGIES